MKTMYVYITRKSKYSTEPPSFYSGSRLRQTPLVSAIHSPANRSLNDKQPPKKKNNSHARPRHFLFLITTISTAAPVPAALLLLIFAPSTPPFFLLIISIT